MNDIAIFNLYPTVVSVEGGEIARDIYGNKVLIDQTLVDAWVDPNAYKAKRAAEYPPIGDQLDALWKGGDAAAEMLATVQAVKAKYPKEQT